MWDDLKNKILGLPAGVGLMKRIRQEKARVPVRGLSGSARALLVSAIAGELGGNFMIVAADPVKARDIEADLVSFGVEGVVSYPEDEILPYDYHDPDRNLTGMQMRALEALCEGECRILVCTLRSVLKKVYSRDSFVSLLLDIVRGNEMDLISLAADLTARGYERHAIVEEKGQFAIRGGILDIFEVSSDDPVRIEFDGDTVITVRDFDVESQRSGAEKETIRIRPFHHLCPDAGGLERLREFLSADIDSLGREERFKRLLPADRLEEGIHFFGMEHYAAAVHELSPIFEYFDSPPVIAIYDMEDMRTLLGDIRDETVERYAASRKEGNFYPPPEQVYISEEELAGYIGKMRTLEFISFSDDKAVTFFTTPAGDYRRKMNGLVTDIRKALDKDLQVFLFCSTMVQSERAEELLSDVSIEIDFPLGFLSGGFRWEDAGVLFLSEEEVFGRFHRPWHSPRARSRSLTYDPSHFKPGDFIVHLSHGVGRYMGMRKLEIEGGMTECLDIRYEGDDRLFIPVSHLRMVEKYIASDGASPALASLGSKAWKKAKERARKSAGNIALDLLEIYAARKVAKGFACGPDKPWQKEVEASFPWEETPHQLEATAEVKKDLENLIPMDRLLCGDVGFGKTEVALRAAFKVVVEGKQAAFLVPTTVLALQHYNTLRERLQGYPVSIEMLSRFVPSARQKKIVEGLAEGKVDIVIGTHRLISKDVHFRDLGLVIVDEEHRFGVKQKEAFKKLKRSVDVLSMTATPIPRTLSMAISGLRDISVIDTAPRNRLPIHTEILPFDDERIREAVMREINRGGQVFFVHNRVQSITVMEGYLQRLLPDRVRIAHAHGQMKERELERIMVDFLEGKFDLLLCTMIIEAGLDFPNVNTIIINRSDRFGLAQLYQLRGRVGRSDRKAHAYMLIPKGRTLTATALKRLQAISEFDYLGAGYRIAMRDLEIRGAGNLLGHQQSGQINSVGLDLYARMIREEIARSSGEEIEEEREAKMVIPVPAYLPEEFVHDSEERMDIYRRVARAGEAGEVFEIGLELRDRFGPLPAPAENMLKLVELRTRAQNVRLDKVEIDTAGRLRARFEPGHTPGKRLLAAIVDRFGGRLTFHTDVGFSLSVKPEYRDDTADGRSRRSAMGKESPGIADFESLLNLLEFSAK
ncbi:MAG: transcription-repair coupling factor [Candidatus Krumholzibacteriota bacterium]|nr:transcription-repair coupling factor [Candidatus Krumholzibacteriota bacterium]